MGLVIDVLLIGAIGGYAAHLIWNMVSSMKAGKGNPYGCNCGSCQGSCGKCHGEGR